MQTLFQFWYRFISKYDKFLLCDQHMICIVQWIHFYQYTCLCLNSYRTTFVSHRYYISICTWPKSFQYKCISVYWSFLQVIRHRSVQRSTVGELQVKNGKILFVVRLMSTIPWRMVKHGWLICFIKRVHHDDSMWLDVMSAITINSDEALAYWITQYFIGWRHLIINNSHRVINSLRLSDAYMRQ